METNNIFSFSRFIQLCKQSLIINKKIIAITIAGFSGFVFLFLILIQIKNYAMWNNSSCMVTFVVLFFLSGAVYSSLSFPAFRTKEKSISYLLLPASAAEKFLFEFLSRIVLFIFLMPLAFWLIANIEGTIMHYYRPEFLNYRFSLFKALTLSSYKIGNPAWSWLAITQGWLFVFVAAFTGASHFSKSPLVKTLFTISIIVLGYALFTYLLVKGINIKGYTLDNDRLLFIHNKNDAMLFLSIAITTVNLCLLGIAYFRLKEREV
jgi:hypothetical protein